MAQRYTVRDNDTLSKIARQFHFLDKGDAIWNANPELQQKTGGNRDVLKSGWVLVIPDKAEKDDDRQTNKRHPFKIPTTRKSLVLVLLDANGKEVEGDWQYRFVQEGQEPQRGTANNGKIILNNIDEEEPNAKIEIYNSTVYTHWNTFFPETISLEIGGLDPITEGEEGIVAIQKILTNLGYYHGRLNGKLDSDTGAAIWGFKKEYMPDASSGEVDRAFCQKLQDVQGFPIGMPAIPEDTRDLSEDFMVPLTLGQKAARKPEALTPITEYEEPTENDLTGPGKPVETLLHSKLGTMRFFPEQAYVAPCDPGDVETKVNRIRMPSRQFVFIDTGNFYSNHTTFGVIWGCHVYLCNYTGTHEVVQAGADAGSKRLDKQLFQALGSSMEVTKRSSASWGAYSDFDWDHLYLIVPDMHLMQNDVAAVWHKEPFGMPFKDYDFDVESKFLAFARTLEENTKAGSLNSLRSRVKVVQLGDSYDLWVGCSPCLFKENKTRTMELTTEDAPQKLAQWVREIAASGPKGAKRNPSIEALDVLERTFSGIEYIYGNHDNYLILPEVCGAAGLQQRIRWKEFPGVFIEHAHRLENKFSDPKPWSDVGEVADVVEDVAAVGAVAGAATLAVGEATGNSTAKEVGKDALLIGSGVALAAAAASYVSRIKGARNYDGDSSGYDAANLLYNVLDYSWKNSGVGSLLIWGGQKIKDVADDQARDHDQPQYISEFARVWIGRQTSQRKKPPHVFVIGHTHIPELLEIVIEPWHTEPQEKKLADNKKPEPGLPGVSLPGIEAPQVTLP